MASTHSVKTFSIWFLNILKVQVWTYLNVTQGSTDMTITSDGTMYQYLSGNSTYSHEYYVSTDVGKNVD